MRAKVNVDAFWFGDPQTPSFGMLHLPPAGRAHSPPVIICPPLGYQNVSSYRSLRALALELTAAGRPTLRFDWPACGESGGNARDAALLPSWLAAVAAASEEVKARTGASHVALVGVRIGATLAAVAAAESADVSELVLWSPAATGKAYIREMRAFQRLAARSYLEPSTPPPALPLGDEEASGFLLSAETIADLSAVDLTKLRWERSAVKRVLMAGTDGVGPDEDVAGVLRAAGIDVDLATLPGLDLILENPNTNKVPHDAFSLILSWLTPGTPALSPTRARNSARLPVGGVAESVVQLESLGVEIVATIATPADRAMSDLWVIFPSAGAVRRSGPNGLWTRFAREWAARGVPSLRLDTPGVGDSAGPDASEEHLERFYSREAIHSVAAGMDYLRDRYGARGFALVGLCSGAFAGFHTSLERDDVVAAVLVNPIILFWDTSERDLAHWSHIVNSITSASQWRRLVMGRTNVGDIPRGAWRALNAALSRASQFIVRRERRGSDHEPRTDSGTAVVKALTRIRERGTKLTFVYSRGELGLTYLRRQLGGSVARITEEFGASLSIVDGADHTFRPLWTQELLESIVESALEEAGVLPAGRRRGAKVTGRS